MSTGTLVSTDTKERDEGYPSVCNIMPMGPESRYHDVVRPTRGVRSQDCKDPGVIQSPRNRVKVEPEHKMVQGMYKRAGYNTKKGVIHIEVNKDAPPPQQMSEEECKCQVVGLVSAQMYSLRKGVVLSYLVRELTKRYTLKALSQVDEFETYQPVHKHELSKEDRKNTLESMMKIQRIAQTKKATAR